jgi:hypothetical protein
VRNALPFDPNFIPFVRGEASKGTSSSFLSFDPASSLAALDRALPNLLLDWTLLYLLYFLPMALTGQCSWPDS